MAFKSCCTPTSMEVIAHRVAYVVFVNLTQPGNELCRLCSLEIGDLLVDRQASLLHKIGRVNASPDAVVEESIRKPTQIRSLRVQQLAERIDIPALGTEE